MMAPGRRPGEESAWCLSGRSHGCPRDGGQRIKCALMPVSPLSSSARKLAAGWGPSRSPKLWFCILGDRGATVLPLGPRRDVTVVTTISCLPLASPPPSPAPCLGGCAVCPDRREPLCRPSSGWGAPQQARGREGGRGLRTGSSFSWLRPFQALVHSLELP